MYIQISRSDSEYGEIMDKFEKLVCGRYVWGKVFLFMEALQRAIYGESLQDQPNNNNSTSLVSKLTP